MRRTHYSRKKSKVLPIFLTILLINVILLVIIFIGYKINKNETSNFEKISDTEILSRLDESAALLKDINYYPSGQVAGPKFACIETNEPVLEISGWYLSPDNKHLYKTYYENTTESVILKNSNGDTKTVQVEVTRNITR